MDITHRRALRLCDRLAATSREATGRGDVRMARAALAAGAAVFALAVAALLLDLVMTAGLIVIRLARALLGGRRTGAAEVRLARQ